MPIKFLELNFEVYKEILVALKDINILNKHWNHMAAALVNMALASLTEEKLTAEDFGEDVKFNKEVEALAIVIDEIDEFINANKADVELTYALEQTKGVESEIKYDVITVRFQ